MLIREAEKAERQEKQGFKDKKNAEKIEKAARKSLSWKVWREKPDPDAEKGPEIEINLETQPKLVKNDPPNKIKPLRIKMQRSKLSPNENTVRPKYKNTIAKYKQYQNPMAYCIQSQTSKKLKLSQSFYKKIKKRNPS